MEQNSLHGMAWHNTNREAGSGTILPELFFIARDESFDVFTMAR